MILDKELVLSDAQTLIGSFSATPVVSTNVIDTGLRLTSSDLVNGPHIWPNLNNGNVVTMANDVGKSFMLELLLSITSAVISAGAATIQFQLVHSDNSDLSAPEILQMTDLIPKATLVVGYQPRLAVPVGVTRRYIGVQYIIGTASTSAGSFHASLVIDRSTRSVG